MPPKRGESIERNEERDEFIAKVQAYHEARGTIFDPEPKVGVRHIDLRKLYERVTSEGGYDLCSDTKAKPLMWRRLAEEFVGKNPYTAAQAFQIKNVYYKNLCAYEISTYWKKEPPPKEILEEVTAKGGNVMTRTLENFEPTVRREERSLAQGDESDGAEGTPEQVDAKDEKQDRETSSGTGRSTRGLRQQPPQRVLFQPDLAPGRQTRGAAQGMPGSPAPAASINGGVNATVLTDGASSALASYEPSQSYPLSLRPVVTPANNPEFYRNERKRKLEATAGTLAKKYRNIMLPGTGFIGPNIYVRAQLALQSGIPEEEQYALHHLVKISHERGDKYRFDQFPDLAEALVKKALQVSGLFYDVEWNISYDEDIIETDDETLNGLHGTANIIQKLRSRTPLTTNDSVQSPVFLAQLGRITEAALIIRNMCLLDENAHFMARMPLMLDYLAVVLNLPQHSATTELQHYALETAEQIVRYCDFGSQDSLYHSLLFQLDRKDRGAITLALRIISRIAMHFDIPKRLEDIPDHILQNVQDWLMIEDEELRSACLDFLMQYTSFADNVDNLLNTVDVESLAQRLSRLLLFAAKEHRTQREAPRKDVDEPTMTVPRLSRSIVESLLEIDEPERSSEWLRMCFLAEPGSEMTQISLWQAYQATFSAFHSTHPHLIAGDFIKNVSTTFIGATAQVAGSNKYVIRGIRARNVPVDTGTGSSLRGSADKGKELRKCCWKITVPAEGQRDPGTGLVSISRGTREVDCAEWFRNSEDMLMHILSSHLHIPRKTPARDNDKMDVDSSVGNGTLKATVKSQSLGATFDFAAADDGVLRCRWADCTRTSQHFSSGKAPSSALLARHIQTHLPDSDASRSKHNVRDEHQKLIPTGERISLTTLTDDRGDATGIPLGAALVLRNIAKFMPRPLVPNEVHIGSTQGKDNSQGNELSMSNIFGEEVMERLFYALSTNKVIQPYVGNILKLVQAGAG